MELDPCVPVILVKAKKAREVYRTTDVEDAQEFVQEFNRREAIRPTGYVALIDPTYWLKHSPEAA